MDSETEALRIELKRSQAELSRLRGASRGSPGADAFEAVASNSSKRSEALLEREKRLLEMIATHQPLSQILEALCRNVEEVFCGALAIAFLFDSKSNRLRAGAAPSMPTLLAELDGFQVTAPVGTCAKAVFLRQQVITADIMSDPSWADYLDVARRLRLRAGWGTPILSNQAQVLGVFSLYWPEPLSPTQYQLETIDRFVRLVAIAMERSVAVDALAASERLARGQAEILTRSLDALAYETDPDRIVEHVLRMVTAQLTAHSCHVWLRGTDRGAMTTAFVLEKGLFCRTFPSNGSDSESLSINEVCGWVDVVRTGRPQVFNDIREGPDFAWRQALLAQGIITIVIVPMIIAGDVEGLMGVRLAEKRSFRPEELELAKALANQAMLAIQLARLSERARQLAVASERTRIAREIHDALAHGFTGVIVHAEAASEAIARSRWDIASNHLRGIGDIARDGLRQARRSVQALRQERLNGKSLARALEEMTAKLTEGTSLKVNVSIEGLPLELPAETEGNILKIGQEVLTNAIRHARAGRFEACLAYDHDHFRLEMRDDGRGFDGNLQHSGFGLRGMAERADEIGARLKVDSTPGSGTRITILLPLRSQENGELTDANSSDKSKA